MSREVEQLNAKGLAEEVRIYQEDTEDPVLYELERKSYDDHGNLIVLEETSYQDPNQPILKTRGVYKYEYDAKGNVIKKVATEQRLMPNVNPDNPVYETSSEIWIYSYKYQ